MGRSTKLPLYVRVSAIGLALSAAHAVAQQPERTDNATLGVSATPDAEPAEGISAVVGAGPFFHPANEGAKNFKVAPFPLVDIRGLFDDRVFISTLRGIGVNIIDAGPFRAGVAVSYAGGRNSSDSPRLKGLSDVSGGPVASGFMTYSIKPVAFEIKAQNIFGPNPGMTVTAGATASFSPIEGMRLSFGPEVTWADSRYDKTYFGVTPYEASQAAADGNPLRPYSPGSGIKDVGFSATALYRLTDHWGLAAHVGLTELVGSAAKDSPLTQRSFQPSIAFGATYKF